MEYHGEFVAIIGIIPATVAAVMATRNHRTAKKVVDRESSCEVVASALGTRQRVLMSAASRPLWETDAEGHVVWANDAFFGMVGAGAEQVMSVRWYPRGLEGQDVGRVGEAWESALEGGSEMTVFCRYRSIGWTRLTMTPLLDGVEVLGWVGSAVPLKDGER